MARKEKKRKWKDKITKNDWFSGESKGKKIPKLSMRFLGEFYRGYTKNLFLRNIRKEQNMFFVHHAGAHFKG